MVESSSQTQKEIKSYKLVSRMSLQLGTPIQIRNLCLKIGYTVA